MTPESPRFGESCEFGMLQAILRAAARQLGAAPRDKIQSTMNPACKSAWLDLAEAACCEKYDPFFVSATASAPGSTRALPG